MKKIMSLTLAVLMCVTLTVPAMAALKSTTLSQGNGGTNVYSWSPTITDVRYDVSGGKFRVVSYFKWNSSNVNTAIDLPSDLYYTMEHNNPKDNGKATYDDLYSNVPYAYYDVEDDENNGYQEELEVSCYSKNDPKPFTANANYFFDTTWHNSSSSSKVMYCAVRSQRSMYAMLNGEMQAHATEFHGRTSNYMIASGTRSLADMPLADDAVSIDNVQKNEVNNEPILVAIEVPTVSAAVSEMQTQWQKVSKEKSLQAKELLAESKAVVTFAEPISNQEVGEILQKANVKAEKFVLRYEDENGHRITGWTSDISDDHLQEKLEYLRVEHGDVSYSGIVSADVTMNLTDKLDYDTLSENENVYFVDLSDSITRIENKDFTRELNVRVPDVSWQLEG